MAGMHFGNGNQDLKRFQVRLGVAGFCVVAAFGALFARFFYLQVVQHDYYHTKAEDNRIAIVPVAPNRGLIFDRNGLVLARNDSAYTLEIYRNRVDDLEATIGELAQIVDITPRDRKRFKRMLEESKGADSLPIRSKLTDEEVARFSAQAYRFPGVEVKARLFRQYPLTDLTAHAVGYIGRINDRDVERLEEEGLTAKYKGSDHIGKVGLEASYEHELHGTPGVAHVEIDAGGRPLRTLSQTPATAGNNLILTLDTKLQKVAEDVFGEFRGALVAIEPSTGGVLAFVSKPGYDPNLFIDGIDPQTWDSLNNNPDHPLNNRALTGAYPPGSTIKPFMALAGLQLGKRSPEFTISDPGSFGLPGVAHRWRDWKAGGHGSVNLHKSIVISCDTYYYGLGNDLGIDNIHSFLSHFGFGQKTGIDIDGEKPGLLPSQEWKMKRFKQKWYAGDTISVSIGQGYNLATPLQLAFATAIVANDGVVYKPHIVRYIEDARTGERREVEPEPLRKLQINPKWLQIVKQAMVDVTKPGGTAGRAGMGATYTFAGKTGTAQVVGMKQGERYDEKRTPERFRDHALFIAYAPAERPTIAVGILVENAGHGGSVAAPIARKVFDYYVAGIKPASPVSAEEEGDGD